MRYAITAGLPARTVHEADSWARSVALAKLTCATVCSPCSIVDSQGGHNKDEPHTVICYYGSDYGETAEAAQLLLDAVDAVATDRTYEIEATDSKYPTPQWRVILRLRGGIVAMRAYCDPTTPAEVGNQFVATGYIP